MFDKSANLVRGTLLSYASAKAAPILGEGGALTEVMQIAENVGTMDADGDGHVSASEAMAFAQKLHVEASPMIAR